MLITTISDTHGKHRQLDLSQYPADILIHAGDWTAGTDIAFVETEEFLDWLEDQPFNHILLIAGNHELTVERHQEFFQELLLSYPKITYLQDSGITIDNIKFYGSPYSNEFCNWAFMEYEQDLLAIWAKIPNDTQVLITHGPAYDCHDQVNNIHGPDDHVGSKSLTQRKQVLQDSLKAHISGHIHEAFGTSTSLGCTNVCASIVDEHYQLVNKPILLEI